MVGLVRFINTIPSRETFELTMNLDASVIISKNFSYQSMTNYIVLKEGRYAFGIKHVNAKLFTGVAFEVKDYKYYTAFAVGTLDNPSKITFIVVGDYTKRIDSDKTRINFFHASTKLSDVDIYIADTKVGSEMKLLSPGFFHGEDSLDLASGDYNISLKSAGTNNNIFGPSPFTFKGGKSYTLVALGIPGNSQFPVNLISYEDD